jgi:SAM-dependent methyltransferase
MAAVVEYRVPDELSDAERERLGHLTTLADRGSAGTLARLGVDAGWACLEVGAGNGSLARWLADRVGPTGRVVATDVDDRFVEVGGAAHLAFRLHDITSGPPEEQAFDVAHARAVLEHLPARDVALANMVAATKPGGLVVVEDIDWHHFDAQPLPEPFATAHFALRRAAVDGYGYDPYYGGRLHLALADVGLVDVEVRGRVFTMRGGTPSAEWYVAAIANALPGLVAAGALSQADADAAIAQARDPAFVLQSQVSNAAWGRVPS